LANARLRKVLAAVLAVPVLASVYLAPLARRSTFLRPALVAAVGGLLTVGSYDSAPAPLQPSPPRAILTSSAALVLPRSEPARALAPTAMASTALANHGVRRSVRVDFSASMDRASVEAAVTVLPRSRVRMTWTSDAKSLQVAPLTTWQPATRYTVTIGAAARDTAGTPLRRSVRVTFLTRPRTTAAMAISRSAGNSPLLATALDLRFSRPVTVASVAAALRVTPAARGSLRALQESALVASRLTWRPSAPLRPGTRYTFSLSGSVRDSDGVTIVSGGTLATRTPSRPTVVRHRPAADARNVDPNALISVRFGQPMARRATERAFAISGLRAQREGSFRWAEGDTVLVYDPARPLQRGRVYQVSVNGSASSARGVPLGARPADAVLVYRFRIAGPPSQMPAALRAAARRAVSRDTARAEVAATGSASRAVAPPPPVAGPTSSAGAPWLRVEQYVLRLVNCIRTGGRLRSDGSCAGYGSGRYSAYLRPLSLHAGISARVARPYAKYLAVRGACNHFLDGDPGDRLRRAGYTSYRWAENLGCRSGDPYRAVLGSHLYFQSEQPYNGGHWRNLKNAKYTTVGIGVWVSNGNVRVITNFYDP
jgi:uncharacterized protein YkwD